MQRLATLRISTLVGAALCLVMVAGAWSTSGAAKKATFEAIQATEEIPEDLLLDVGIHVLNPGLPEEETADEKEKAKPRIGVSESEEKGIFEELRRSEARFFAFHLKSTLESTGNWGAVRVLPRGASATDVTVTGEIRRSTGLIMSLHVEVVDATGARWLEKSYAHEADPGAYEDDDESDEPVIDVDPYQSLFNRIANDMLKARSRLKEKRLRDIRETTRLRFAADLAPTAFDDYIQVRSNGRYRIRRLPAEDDAMMARVDRIRQRDEMFVDALNAHYAGFYDRMEEPYEEWRAASYEEEEALRRIRRKARKMAILGGILAMGGLMSSSSSDAGRAVGDAAVIGGAMMVNAGIEKSREGQMHKEALRELGASVDAEVTPLLIEVEGRTLRLEGSAEAQYTQWRRLLAEIFATETGLPVGSDDAGDPESTDTSSAGTGLP